MDEQCRYARAQGMRRGCERLLKPMSRTAAASGTMDLGRSSLLSRFRAYKGLSISFVSTARQDMTFVVGSLYRGASALNH